MFNKIKASLLEAIIVANKVVEQEVYMQCDLGNKSVVALRYDGNILIITNKNREVSESLVEKAQAYFKANNTLAIVIL